jgi:phosphatidylserine decarboxylase
MSIVRDAWVPAALFAALGLSCGWLLHPWAAAPWAVLVVFTLWFFRDPERRPPDDPSAWVSPADGRVIRTGPDRVSVFMNVFDVHVCRAPTAGKVVTADHRSGGFVAAWRDDASEHNERLHIELQLDGTRARFTLVAGLVARRIVEWVEVGQSVERGERIGLIRFGSRVDVDLPPGAEVAVEVGDRVVAGETVLLRRPPRDA